MNAVNTQEAHNSPDCHLNAEQARWLNEQVIPCPLYLKSATAFDDTHLDTSGEIWKFKHSGRKFTIDFESGKNFISLSKEMLKLIKFACVVYASENNASNLYSFANEIAKSVKGLANLEHDVLYKCALKKVEKILTGKDLLMAQIAIERALDRCQQDFDNTHLGLTRKINHTLKTQESAKKYDPEAEMSRLLSGIG